MKLKERVDVLLVQQGLFDTREQAKRAVMAGLVYIKEERVDKPGEKIELSVELNVKGQRMPYVSRGGLKLEKALKAFDFEVTDKIMLDIGSSTGGFTDCALQHGAKMSYALDVGSNQLAWKLRNDERVEVMEHTNFRYVEPENFTKGVPEFATIDVSFISLRLILPTLTKVIAAKGDVMALIKPQFEAGREQVGKKGIVRDEKVHQQVIEDVLSFSQKLGFDVKNLSFSPITGGEGNIEFIAHLNYVGEASYEGQYLAPDAIKEIVTRAHHTLKA